MFLIHSHVLIFNHDPNLNEKYESYAKVRLKN